MVTKKITKFIVPKAWRRADVLLSSLVINLTTLALPLVILQVYDRILPNHAVDTFVVMVVFLVMAAVLEAFLRIARSTILSWQGAKYEHQQSIEALDRILHSDLTRFESEPVGSYLDKFDALKQVREFFTGQSILMLVDLPFVLLFLSLIWVFAQELVLVPLAVMGLFAVVSYVLGKRLRATLQRRSEANERKQNFLIEVLQGVHVVKSMALEAPMLRRFERLQDQSATMAFELGKINGFIQSTGATFSQVVMMSFVAVGAIHVVEGDLTIGALAAGTMLSGRVMQPALKAMGLWTQIQGLKVAIERLEELFYMRSERVDAEARAKRIEGHIELVDVHFKYFNAERNLLEGINLEIKPGEIVGITGPNGSGKSTLIELIMGFTSPTKGTVEIDGLDVSMYERSSLRAQIGYVPQYGVIFEGTILENMTLFREGAAIDRALQISRKIGLTSYLMKLPEGLDTPISGSNRDVVPAGVRQQIIFVRSLVGSMIYGEPGIVLFDDSSSSLDMEHDNRLREFLSSMRGRQTILIVSHRPSLLQLCERQYVLSKGQLLPVEQNKTGRDTNAIHELQNIA